MSVSSKPPQPKVGIVVGSGGIKAFAALALFDFLAEEQIAVDFMAGCSGGALAVAAYGAGYTLPQIRQAIADALDPKLFARLDYRTFLGMANLPFGHFDLSSGILKTEAIRQAYHKIFGNLRIEDLHPTTVIQATNVVTGEGVVLSQGLVADAVYASSAGFPLLPPICIDGNWLVDGAYSSSLPVLEAVNRGMDVIIAAAFRQHLHEALPKSFFEHTVAFLGRTTNINESRELSLAIDLHHHEIVLVDVHFDRVVQMWEADALPLVFAMGQRALEPKKREIRAAIANFPAAPQ